MMRIDDTFKKKWKQYHLPKKDLNDWLQQVQKIQEQSEIWEKCSSFSLLEKSRELQLRAKQNEQEEALVIEACALVDLACRKRKGETVEILGKKRIWTLTFYPTQFFAALALLKEEVVEQSTGEGKTFSLMISAYVLSLFYPQLHIMTANTYLAERDFALYRFILEPLGVSCAYNGAHLSWREKQALYSNTILFGTVQDFGFDYLRNHLVRNPKDSLWHKQSCTLLDEVDSILLDEASTPLILCREYQRKFDFSQIIKMVQTLQEKQQEVIFFLLQKLKNNLNRFSKKTQIKTQHQEKLFLIIYTIQLGDPKNKALYELLSQYQMLSQHYFKQFTSLRRSLEKNAQKDLYYKVNEEKMYVYLTEKGLEWLTETLGEDPYEIKPGKAENKRAREHIFLIDRLLTAFLLLKKDVHYILSNQDICLVDPLTGRKQEGKRLRFGIHNALRIKENIQTSKEEKVCGQITIQSYLNQYSFRSGTCGVAFPAQKEFDKNYQMRVIPIPTYRPEIRYDYPVLGYGTFSEKMNALISLLEQARSVGRPVLIGTRDILNCENIAHLLTQQNFSVQILSAKNTEIEHHVLSQAGAFAQITVATNVAGRGADIVVEKETLEKIAERYIQILKQEQNPPVLLKIYSLYEKTLLEESLTRQDQEWSCLEAKNGWEATSDSKKSREDFHILDVAIGLETILVEVMEEMRIEEQFRRRAGRQGVPGVSRVLISLEDSLLNLNLSYVPGIVFQEEDLRKWQETLSQRNCEFRDLLMSFDHIYNFFRLRIYTFREELLQNKIHWSTFFSPQWEEYWLVKEILLLKQETEKRTEEELALCRKVIQEKQKAWAEKWDSLFRETALRECDQWAESFIFEAEFSHQYAFYHQGPFDYYFRELERLFFQGAETLRNQVLQNLTKCPLPLTSENEQVRLSYTSRSVLQWIEEKKRGQII